jgi:hypothetical protein
LFGEHVESKGATKHVGFGETFGSSDGFEALIDLVVEANLKASGGHDDP